MSNIEHIRASLGLTQAKLARILGCTQPNIVHYERHSQSFPIERAYLLIEYAAGKGLPLTLDDVYRQADLAQQKETQP